MAVLTSSSTEDLPAPHPGITDAPEPEERRLLAAARAGDREAYGQLLARHQEVAFRAAFLITGSASDAEEAAQEASVKAWLALDRFQRPPRCQQKPRTPRTPRARPARDRVTINP